MTNVLGEEQVLYNLQHQTEAPKPSVPVAEVSKPKRTGYEPYQDPGYIPEIQAKSSVWGAGIVQKSKPAEQQQTAPQQVPASARKILSLEEVEAQMRAQSHKPETKHEQPHFAQPPPMPLPHGVPPHMQYPHQPFPQPEAFPPPFPQKDFPPINHYPPAPRDGNLPPGFHRQPQRPFPEQQSRPNVPMQMLQHPQRIPNIPPQRSAGPPISGPYAQQQQPPPPPSQLQPQVPPTTGGQVPSIAAMHPQFMQLPEEQRKALLAEDAKRAKRNHKIHILSRGNGLMTPQDKNFITRIQLQQLVSATGNTGDTNDSLLSEDFYYQVYSQIRGAPRQHPRQPLGHFAQTYLFQTGNRGGSGGRRQYQNADNHMQRMQQQVQRAVEAAKLRPKNKQLIIEGSLGKISFSNAKNPRTILSIKRPDSADGQKPTNVRKSNQASLSPSDRKSILHNIEKVYTTLMKMEDHERKMPPPPDAEDAEAVEKHLEWRQQMDALNRTLWADMKVHEPIFPGSTTTHPFIAFLSYPKGKKAIPRIFRHINQEQRVTILTMIIVHLDSLDVVQRAQLQPGETQPPGPVREEIDLFSQAVMPSLLGYVSEAPLKIIIGLLGLIVFRVDIGVVSKTRIGLGILTMLLSRAELVKEAGAVDDGEWKEWTDLYNQLFDRLEPLLGDIFPGTINSGDDMYVWQFLAAVGIGASPEQQQRLVIAVK